MHTFRLLLAAALLSQAVGCSWVDNWKAERANGPRPGGKLPDVNPNQLVTYLNDRSTRLQSLNYDDVRVRCFEKGLPMPALDGNLACSQPRNFRMVGQGRTVSAKVDLGSNTDQFWVFVQVPTEKPVYVFASHADFEAGRARLPGGIPFESDWVLQSLGMTMLPPTATYQVEINERERTYTLYWPATTPSGLVVRKEIVFDGDAATGTRPQVKRHVMRDAKTNKPICSAEIKSAHTFQVGSDPRTGYPLAVQYPTSMTLKWEEQRFEMDMTMEKAQVNQTMSPELTSRLFTRPLVPNVQAIDLAKYEFR